MSGSEEMKTEQQIVDNCNALARLFYRAQGCKVPDDFLFYKAHHPAEVGCWNMAVLAYDFIEGTDVQDCLLQLEDAQANQDGDQP